MRIEKHQKCRICFAFSICIILFFSIFSSLSALAQEEETLFIVIHDSETNLPIEENIFLEGKKYDIAIGCEGQYGYVYNVTVSVPWTDPFITSEELPWITIETPDFEECIKLFLDSDLRIRFKVARHIFGSHESDWAVHKDFWSKDKFEFILTKLGFEIIEIKQFNSILGKISKLSFLI